MAAYAALLSLKRLIDDIVNHHSPPISLDEQQLDSLNAKISFLMEFLEGYSSPVADIDDEADVLEVRIIEAAYAAEDVIESYIVHVITLGRTTTTTTTTHDPETDSDGDQTTATTSIPGEEANCGEEVNCIKLYEDLHQVIEEMDLITKATMKIDSEKAIAHDQPQLRSFSAASDASSTGQMSIMVCSDDVLNGIMEKLVSGQPELYVIPIVGMGGIGKTTLAKNLYVKPFITEYFDICAWATISQQYNTKEILCELVSQTSNKTKEFIIDLCEQDLGLMLHKYLFGRRFLIVMDDMWSIDAWDKVQHFFPNNDNGSRILVTTRISQLSSQLNNNYSHQMEFLDEISSWDLFLKTIFGEENCPPELVKIGKEIVENCRGLPLSIVVVGGLLKKMERTQVCWDSIRSSLTFVVNSENDKHCFRLLKKSYDHLPMYLKPCFLYMAVFREDYEIPVSVVIQLWISEGFLRPIKGESLETTAKGFLKNLVHRNLILIGELGSTRNIKYCRIHDLVRDLCLKESRKYELYHVVGVGSRRGINSERRVFIRRGTSEQKVADAMQYGVSNTRSVIYENESVPPNMQNFGLLRILEAQGGRYSDSFVKALFFQCVSLRHLAIGISRLPLFLSSLLQLWNLHTLIVYCSYSDSNVPDGIWKMPQFMHIRFIGGSRVCLPSPTPPDGGDDRVVMENLEILKGVADLKIGEEVVKRIPNVRKLGLKYYWGEEEYVDDYCLENIKCLGKLESLELSYADASMNVVVAASLSKLIFPYSLLSLDIRTHSNYEWKGMLDKIGALPLLQKLIVYAVGLEIGEWKMIEGQFPSLVYLELIGCDGLRRWTAQDYCSVFPRLEQLYLYNLEYLEEIPSEIGEIPTLQEIKLVFCSEAAVMSAKSIVDEQVETQGDQLPFHVVVRVFKNDENEVLQSLAGPNFKESVFLIGPLIDESIPINTIFNNSNIENTHSAGENDVVNEVDTAENVVDEACKLVVETDTCMLEKDVSKEEKLGC